MWGFFPSSGIVSSSEPFSARKKSEKICSDPFVSGNPALPPVSLLITGKLFAIRNKLPKLEKGQSR
jgi:hypothetical protein